MKCPQCGCIESKCKDSRHKDGTVYRRRECVACGRKFSTVEVSQEAYNSMLYSLSSMQRKLQKLRAVVQNIIEE